MIEKYRIHFARNLVHIGSEKLIQFTARNLRIKTVRQCKNIITEETNNGYEAECCCFTDKIWSLIVSLSKEHDTTIFHEPKYKTLKEWCLTCSAAKMTSLPTERSLKHYKKAEGSEKGSAETLKCKYNNKMNDKQCLETHSADIARSSEQNGKPDPKLLQTQKDSNNEYDYCWDIMTNEEWLTESKIWGINHKPENHNYKQKQKSSKYAKGQKYEPIRSINKNKKKVISIKSNIGKTKRKNFSNNNNQPIKKRKLQNDDCDEQFEETEDPETELFTQMHNQFVSDIDSIDPDEITDDWNWERQFMLKKHIMKPLEKAKSDSNDSTESSNENKDGNRDNDSDIDSDKKGNNAKKYYECFICGQKKNVSTCSICKSVFYCSREHQTMDWSRHSQECVNKINIVLVNSDMDVSGMDDSNRDISDIDDDMVDTEV